MRRALHTASVDMMNAAASRRRACGAEAGFTLIELLVVLAVLALAIAALQPFATRRPVGLEVVAAQVATSLRGAREAAISADRPIALLIQRDGTAYQFSTARAGVQLPPGVRLSYQPSAGFHRAGLGGTLAFYVDGTSSGGVVVVRDAKAAIALTIEPISGAVRRAPAP